MAPAGEEALSRVAFVLLSIGFALFVGLLAWQGFGAVASALSHAGWGLLVVAAFHLLPLAIDAAALRVLFERRRHDVPMPLLLVARWIGESVNSLMPAGQLGGPVVMVRQLARAGVPLTDAAAALAVNTTVMAFTQVVFAITGLVVFAIAAHGVAEGLRLPAAIAIAFLLLSTLGFYWAQRRGMFGNVLRFVAKTFGRDWSGMTARADAIDDAVAALYRKRRRIAATCAWSLLGWFVGTGEVWLALDFLGHPVGLVDALFLESAGQAIRGAAFAIPGSLGAQEGGFLLLAPLVGLPLDVALALSLVKRARELALGLPGILVLHLSERHRQVRVAVAD